MKFFALIALIALCDAEADPGYGHGRYAGYQHRRHNAPQCRTVYDTITEQVCSTITESVCFTTSVAKTRTETREECITYTEQDCATVTRDVPEQQCATTSEQQCTNIVKQVPEQVCETVTDEECIDEAQCTTVGTPSPASSCSAGTICGRTTNEPISEEVKIQRETASCTLDNEAVEAISPLSSSNPQNVKNVEAIFPESKFNEFFPKRNSAYTYANFIKAIGKYPAICSDAALCPKILANMFAHIQQETTGLLYLEEINKSPYCAEREAYPCASGKMYYGRGAKQLSWNYNYGAFSNAMFGDAMVLLNDPERVATTWLNFAASMWFYVTPQPPKPSMLQILDGSWTPNSADLASNLAPGFGVTTMIINGALECGRMSQEAQNRANHYTDYAARLGVDITGEKLLCNDMQQFSSDGSAGQMKLYWAPESSCSLVTWQTAYSALIEGDHAKCQGLTPSCGSETTTGVANCISVPKCTPVARQQCSVVSRDVPDTVCVQVPKTECSTVTRQVPETVCTDKPVIKCAAVPFPVTVQVPVERCDPVARQECHPVQRQVARQACAFVANSYVADPAVAVVAPAVAVAKADPVHHGYGYINYAYGDSKSFVSVSRAN